MRPAGPVPARTAARCPALARAGAPPARPAASSPAARRGERRDGVDFAATGGAGCRGSASAAGFGAGAWCRPGAGAGFAAAGSAGACRWPRHCPRLRPRTRPARAPTGGHVAGLAVRVDHLAGHRRGHLDRRLVGHDVDQRLVLLTMSPTSTCQATISASAVPSPTSGSLKTIASHAQPSITRRSASADARRAREILPFEGVRIGRVPAGHALDRRLQVIEAVSPAPAPTARRRSRWCAVASCTMTQRPVFFTEVDDGLDVDRQQGAQVDHLGVDARFLGGGQRHMDHGAVGQHGDVVALAHDRAPCRAGPCSSPPAPRRLGCFAQGRTGRS